MINTVIACAILLFLIVGPFVFAVYTLRQIHPNDSLKASLAFRSWLGIWLALAITLSVIQAQIGYQFNRLFLLKMILNGTTTNGEIVHVVPSDHCRTTFKYEANGSDFLRVVWGFDDDENFKVDCIHTIGRTRTLYYDASDPTRVIHGNPIKMLIDSSIFLLIICTIGATLIVKRLVK